MMFKYALTHVALAAIILLDVDGSSLDSAVNFSNNDSRLTRCRKLIPSDSIAEELKNEHAGGNSNPSLMLVAEVAGSSNDTDIAGFFSVFVYEPTPAVTKKTTYSAFGGPREFVGELDHTILVADTDEEDDGTVVLLSVNKATEEVDGIVQKNGQNMKITQTKGNNTWAFEAPEFVPPVWECGVGREK